MRPATTIAKFLVACILLYLIAFVVLVKVRIGPYPAIHSLSDALNVKGGNTWQKFQEFDATKQYDIVFIGSSHAYRGYDPAFFVRHGYTAFNLGTSAQTMLNSSCIVDAYLTSKNTKLLVLDVFERAFEMDGLESTADLTQNISSDKAALCMAWGLKDPRALNMLTLRMLTGDVSPYHVDSAYVGMGFSTNRTTAGPGVHYIVDRAFEPTDEQVVHFERILGLCEERGISVVLVDHPRPTATKGPGHAQFNAWLARYVAAHDLAYLDMAYAPGFDDTEHFFDHTHLNMGGVRLFNGLLLDRLWELGLLPRTEK